METQEFRLATVYDIDQLVLLRLEMQREVHALPGGWQDAQYMQELRAYFEHAIPAGSYLSAVAESGGKIISANGVIIYRKPPSATGGKGYVGYVSNVYTLPQWRGQGIAEKLMRLAVQVSRARGLDKLHLGATDAGKSVYERVGFRNVEFPYLELKLL